MVELSATGVKPDEKTDNEVLAEAAAKWFDGDQVQAATDRQKHESTKSKQSAFDRAVIARYQRLIAKLAADAGAAASAEYQADYALFKTQLIKPLPPHERVTYLQQLAKEYEGQGRLDFLKTIQEELSHITKEDVFISTLRASLAKLPTDQAKAEIDTLITAAVGKNQPERAQSLRRVRAELVKNTFHEEVAPLTAIKEEWDASLAKTGYLPTENSLQNLTPAQRDTISIWRSLSIGSKRIAQDALKKFELLQKSSRNTDVVKISSLEKAIIQKWHSVWFEPWFQKELNSREL